MVLFLLGAGIFLFLGILWPEAKVQDRRQTLSANSPQAEKLVNKHLWMTNHQAEIAQQKVKAQNAYMAPHIGDSIWPQKAEPQNNLGVDHSPDRYETNAYDDLNRYRKDLRTTNPDSIIQGQIADQQRQQQYAEAYRIEYAKQFVENARRNGYHVQLSKDFVVLSVTPLSKNQQRNPSLFEGASRKQAK